jgi:hypothetical protein
MKKRDFDNVWIHNEATCNAHKHYKGYLARIDHMQYAEFRNCYSFFIRDRYDDVVLEGFVKSKKKAQKIIDFWFSTLKFKKKK